MLFLESVRVKNYRCLADVDLDLRDVNVLFGPNGGGKSTLIDLFRFLRDCLLWGVDGALSRRDHGAGLIFDRTKHPAVTSALVRRGQLEYEVALGLERGRVNPMAGEFLGSTVSGEEWASRHTGSSTALIARTQQLTLRDPNQLGLPRYLDYLDYRTQFDAFVIHDCLRLAQLHHSPSLDLAGLRAFGSSAGSEGRPEDSGLNLWSVLRNLQGRRAVESGYDTILRFMARSFPEFRDLVIEATSPTVVYGSFVQSGHDQPVPASRVADGHMHMLVLLTALFSGGPNGGLVLLDEPETSLHPWALAVLAEAIQHAADQWRRQVIVATHSPVLLGQFDAHEILAAELGDNGTRFRRLSEMSEVKDLLDQYSAGSLYMSDLLAGQGESRGTPIQ
jgi:predicted ATPase